MPVNELCGAIYGILKLMVLNELHTFEFGCLKNLHLSWMSLKFYNNKILV